jgi:hypothetical protein
LETVNPPRENARSTSVEVAIKRMLCKSIFEAK